MNHNNEIISTHRGMFPYQCPLCGGASERCGTNKKNNENNTEISLDDDNHYCGKYCWEDDVVYLYKKQYRTGIYSGYGYAIDILDIDLQVSTYYFNVIWKLNIPFYSSECNEIVDDFYCTTCFEKKLLLNMEREEMLLDEWCYYYTYYYQTKMDILLFLHHDISLLKL